jgi:type IV pilus assembly protein PilB
MQAPELAGRPLEVADDLDDQLAGAGRPTRPATMPRIGEMMIERGLISPEQLDAALNDQRVTGRRMGEILVEMGALSSLDLASILAERLGYPFVDLSERSVDVVLATMIPEEVARRYQALPIARNNDSIVIAMANPENVFALDDLRVLTSASITPVMTESGQLRAAIDRAYSRSDVHASLDDAASDLEDDLSAVEAVDAAAEGPIVRLVHALLEQAVSERASDVHVEPLSDRVRVRYRTDGVLHEASETPLSVLRPLVSRVKVLAGIDITARRTPQDGRFTLEVNGRQVDVRVATLPTVWGEAIVMRLLDRLQGVRTLDELGLTGGDTEAYQRAFRAAQGWVVVSGPTGSGKTSTLYATLAELNSPDRSIISVEDPVEYQLDGIKQIQINRRAGLTFPSALRSILRSDPDIVLVGEVRDGETARIAAEAAITGHLVFSTVHATSAAAVPMRMIDMGVEPYLVASSMTCAVAQRLARVLCTHCAEPDDASFDILRELGCDDETVADATILRPVGCAACQRTGYRGRFALYEVLPFSEEISRLVLGGAASHEIERRAIAEGMDTLGTVALHHVLRGRLGVEEMLRVVA